MTLLHLPWNDAYGYSPGQASSSCPSEITHLRTGATMRLVPRGAFQMGLSPEGWESFGRAVLQKAPVPPITNIRFDEIREEMAAW